MTRRRDRGGALIGTLVLTTVAALVAYPMMDLIVALRAHGDVVAESTRRLEAVRGAGRVLLADPAGLAAACAGATEAPAVLADHSVPGVSGDAPITVRSTCVETGVQRGVDTGEVLVTLTGVGAVLPAGITTVGPDRIVTHADDYDPALGGAAEEFWLFAGVTAEPTAGQIWLPALPLLPPEAAQPVVTSPGCTTWTPGTHPAIDADGDGSVDPLSLAGDHYFASGIHHFERPVLVAPGARIVFGRGSVAGCSNDAVARLQPGGDRVSGLGATVVFGRAGSLRVDDGGAAATTGVVVQRRLPAPGDPNSHLAGVAITTVTGATDPADVSLPGLLFVPESQLVVVPPGAPPVVYVIEPGYGPVVGLPPCDPDPDTGTCTGALSAAAPLIDLAGVDTDAVTLDLGGALVAPQSRIALAEPTGGATVSVRIRGAMTVASIDVVGQPAATLPPGVEVDVITDSDLVVQRSLRLESIVVEEGPNITSTVEVVVNQTGTHAVTSWQIG